MFKGWHHFLTLLFCLLVSPFFPFQFSSKVIIYCKWVSCMRKYFFFIFFGIIFVILYLWTIEFQVKKCNYLLYFIAIGLPMMIGSIMEEHRNRRDKVWWNYRENKVMSQSRKLHCYSLLIPPLIYFLELLVDVEVILVHIF